MSFLEKHKKLERNTLLLLIFAVVAVLIGGLVEVIPLFRMETVIEPVKGVRPYTPLELTGFNIYIREGCYVCHSQQVRPLRDEVARYGHYSLAAESMYDHPFQWGSKRTGPDLARVGGKYSDDWHTEHLKNPRSVVPESIMPSYSFLARTGADLRFIAPAMKSLRASGVPYTDEMIENAEKDALNQATGDERGNTDGMHERYPKAAARDFDGNPNMVSEMDALVAYLQVLGTMVDFNAARDVEGGAQ
ncbi:MAG: cytochrome-c oxidase, cbb3-type subunit II [Alphaproteobacteria bacterium]|nr:cytochrome-c oxidase, cbb3-type subunit II [Alphaproteobacteria bacterium]